MMKEEAKAAVVAELQLRKLTEPMTEARAATSRHSAGSGCTEFGFCRSKLGRRRLLAGPTHSRAPSLLRSPTSRLFHSQTRDAKSRYVRHSRGRSQCKISCHPPH